MLYNNMHEDITTPNLGVFTAATSGIADSRVSSPGAGILALVVGLSGVGVDPAVALGRVRAGEVGHQGRVGQCDAALRLGPPQSGPPSMLGSPAPLLSQTCPSKSVRHSRFQESQWVPTCTGETAPCLRMRNCTLQAGYQEPSKTASVQLSLSQIYQYKLPGQHRCRVSPWCRTPRGRSPG